MRLVQPFPCRWSRPGNDCAIRSADFPAEPFLYVLAQSVVNHELRCFRALRSLLRLPLSHQRPVLGLSGSGRSISADLTRDCAGIAPDTTGNLTHSNIACTQQCDFLTLSEGQVTA